MMRLCFGTFAHVLRLCKLKAVTDRQLVGTMTRTIDPDCRYIEKGNDTAVSRLLSCDANFPTSEISGGSGAYRKPGESLSNIYQLSLKMKTKDITPKFQDFVLPFIDEDKKSIAVLALVDIIRRDLFIDKENKMKFEKYLGTTKNALLSQGEFVLADFLSGLFLYTVVSVRNTVGKVCVKEINEEYINSFKDKKRFISFLEYKEASKSNDDIYTETDDELSEKYDESYTDEPDNNASSNTTNQVVDSPFVFNQYGNNNIQIGSIEKLTINNG